MLEKRILEKILELLDINDKSTVPKMLERSGVKFLFTNGQSGLYQAGMMKMDGVDGLHDFNPEAIVGYMLADTGAMTGSGMEVDQASVIQDLQNQLAEEQHRLAEALETIDNQIKDYDSLVKEFDEYKAGGMDKAESDLDTAELADDKSVGS